MASLKKYQNLNDQPKKSEVIENSPMNEEEMQSAKNLDEITGGATAERLDFLLNLVSSKFGFDDTYAVRKFDDKGKVISITLENEDFIVAVTVKNGEQHGLFVE